MEDIQKQGAKNVELSTPKTILLAFQHLLAMYAGDILVPLLIFIWPFFWRFWGPG